MQRPIDLYLGFDPHFFCSQREREAENYHTFLNHNGDIINSILEEPTAKLQDKIIYAELETFEQYEYAHPPILGKTKEMSGNLNVTRDNLLQKVGVHLQHSQRAYLTGRIGCHLIRFLFPEKYAAQLNQFYQITQKPANSFCEQFGTELIKFISILPEEIRGEDGSKLRSEKFQSVVGSEGPNVFLFWSTVPYIHLNLKERGLNAEQSISKIMDWAISAYREGWNPEEFKIDHLSLLEKQLSTLFRPLGYDERMPTHLRRRLLSRMIAGKLI